MKLRVISDLHLESAALSYTPGDEDVLVMAGDISSNIGMYKEFIEEINIPIVVIPGNHEFYGHEFNSHLSKLRDVGYLYNEVKVIDDVHFICGTGWTDFELEGNSGRAKYNAATYINDFRRIRYNDGSGHYRNWKTYDCRKYCMRYKNFMRKALLETEGKKRIVVSHFLPLKECISPQYADSEVNAYFASNMSEFTKQVPLYIHGHTHDSLDFMHEGTRILCNPRGYGNENMKNFNPNLIIEV